MLWKATGLIFISFTEPKIIKKYLKILYKFIGMSMDTNCETLCKTKKNSKKLINYSDEI